MARKKAPEREEMVKRINEYFTDLEKNNRA